MTRASLAALRIYPDVDRVHEGLRGTVEKPLTRLTSRLHVFRLRLPGWADAKVQRQEGPAWVDVPDRAGQLSTTAGVYRLLGSASPKAK